MNHGVQMVILATRYLLRAQAAEGALNGGDVCDH